MLPLDVLAYYFAKFSTIESKVINAIMGKNLNFQVDNFDMTKDTERNTLRKELKRSKKFDESEIDELMKFKQKY